MSVTGFTLITKYIVFMPMANSYHGSILLYNPDGPILFSKILNPKIF